MSVCLAGERLLVRRRGRRAVVVHRGHRVLDDVDDGGVELVLLAAEQEVREAGGAARAGALQQRLDLAAAARLHHAGLGAALAQQEALLEVRGVCLGGDERGDGGQAGLVRQRQRPLQPPQHARAHRTRDALAGRRGAAVRKLRAHRAVVLPWDGCPGRRSAVLVGVALRQGLERAVVGEAAAAGAVVARAVRVVAASLARCRWLRVVVNVLHDLLDVGLADALEEEGDHVALALDVHRPAAAQLVAARRQDVIHLLRHLNVVQQPGRVHARGDVDRVAPDVVLRLAGADHAGHHWPNVDANSDPETVE
ncbi:unnamed protein product [Chrysodeixis includens]|uniref:Uncharacterized protein n=1 Tax=Chrysodeixis includens TaxID=689277 RepID=A0A9N8KZY2_CHRIL|nr:unnamed protein product [Chrysodeixis includens]